MMNMLIAMMNMFNTHMTKAVKATVPDIYSQVNETYDDLRPNPFSGIAAWKLISTLYAGADVLREDVLREQLRLAIADDGVMPKALNKLHEGRFINQSLDIKEWHKFSDVSKELMNVLDPNGPAR
jgi:hypothetical protein